MMDFKNVIILILDGIRHDWVDKLPYLKNLAGQSVFFDKMITYGPYSVASSCSLFTGVYGSRSGVDNYYGSINFDKRIKPIYELLKEKGYFTALVTPNNGIVPKSDIVDKFIHHSFDISREDQIVQCKGVISEAKSSGKPFFISIHHLDHNNRLYLAHAKKYDPLQDDYFSDLEMNASVYSKWAEDCDLTLKDIHLELKEQGLIDNTLLFVVSDHGISLGDRWGENLYGTYCFDYTLRVFCVISNPHLPKLHCSSLIRNVDVAPTIMDLLRIDSPESKLMDGMSFVNLIKGGKDERVAYAETAGLGGPTPSPKKPNVFCVRTNGWKMVYNSSTGIKQLYDLEHDPYENSNLIMQNPDKGAELWGLMKNFSKDRI